MSPTVRGLLLVALATLAVMGIASLGTWAVEDAAISWAYAQNIAAGLGPVPWPGAEPVEGYSNPTWVALLAAAAIAGLHPLWASKLLAMALTALTVPLVYRLGSRLVPDAPDATGLAAAALFAVHSQVAIYGAAGLENPLFNLLMAAGLVRLLDEQREPGAPWSALWFALLAGTRPDGIGYGVMIGVLTTIARVRRGADRVEISRWWLALLAPLFVYNLGRWAYFGWELPSTAYAKISDGYEHLWSWQTRGWIYTREWATGTGQVWFGWLYLVALMGTRRKALTRVLLLTLISAALYLAPWTHVIPLNRVRTAWPLALGAALWLGASRRDDRGTLLACAMASTFFAVWARGDWMSGGRWFAMAAVPMSALLAAGMADWVGLLDHRRLRGVRRGLLAALIAGFAVCQVSYVKRFADDGYEISPWMIRDRVRTAQTILEQLQYDDRPLILTVDMGAFLMWSGMEHIDIVGLTDVAMAQHRTEPWQRAFFTEYVVEERRPEIFFLGSLETELIHSEGFTDQYFQTHGYWRVRKDLLFADRWEGPEGRRVDYEGTSLLGWEIPAQPTVAGGPMYIEFGIENRDQRVPDWRAFLVDDAGDLVAHWRLFIAGPDPAAWPKDAVFRGRTRLDLPDDLAPGTYRIGFAMRTPDAWNAPDLDSLPTGVRATPADAVPRVMPGEVLFDQGVTIAPRAEVEPLVEAHRQQALSEAAAGDCEQARRTWFLARRHGLPREWSDQRDPELRRARATCWLQRAAQTTGAERIDLLERARRLDDETPGLAPVLEAEADRLQAEGDVAREAKDDETAYAAYRDALRLDPSRPWLRRYAEEARRRRLR